MAGQYLAIGENPIGSFSRHEALGRGLRLVPHSNRHGSIADGKASKTPLPLFFKEGIRKDRTRIACELEGSKLCREPLQFFLVNFNAMPRGHRR